MITKQDKNQVRKKRHARVRSKISGTTQRPRLNVYRSNKNIYAQIIDDSQGVTLVSASTMDKGFEGSAGNVEAASKIGETIAKKAAEKNAVLKKVFSVVEEVMLFIFVVFVYT